MYAIPVAPEGKLERAFHKSSEGAGGNFWWDTVRSLSKGTDVGIMEELGWNTVFQVVISEDVLVVIIRDNYRKEMKQTLLPAISFRCSIGELDGPFLRW
jgi:hypothetical protein